MYTKEQIEKMNKTYRECLKPYWKELDFKQTDSGLKEPIPEVFKTYHEGEVLELKKDVNGISKKDLDDIIMSRRSIRRYLDEPISFEQLSYLMKLTCYIRRIGPGIAQGVVPTGGARNALETYIYVRKAAGFKPGLYHYMKDTNNVRLIKENLSDEFVNEALNNQLRDCAAIVFWSCIPKRSEYKYSYTAHKMIAMEAGHACQNLYLACEAIDFGTVALNAYDQDKVDDVLGIGDEEFTIYIATLGKK